MITKYVFYNVTKNTHTGKNFSNMLKWFVPIRNSGLQLLHGHVHQHPEKCMVNLEFFLRCVKCLNLGSRLDFKLSIPSIPSLIHNGSTSGTRTFRYVILY